LKIAKDELQVMNSLDNLPILIKKTNEPDMKIFEDEHFVVNQMERQ
tara:strand:+ start:1336 stop:1473 length:138 start_codon:yes stop_codon:yes gene_type:complete